MQKEPNASKFLSILTAVIFIASLIPLLFIARYNHSCADDYTYGLSAHHTVLAGGSLWQILKSAFGTVKYFWHNWQGTYFSMFLMALQPGIFSEKLYFLSTWIMLASLCFGTMFFFDALLHKLLKWKRSLSCTVSMLLLLITVQTLTSPCCAILKL